MVNRHLLIMAGLAFALVCAELALRAIGYSAPLWHTPDPTLGWVLRPNTSGMFTQEGRAFVSINSDGMRDREHTIFKPAGMYRIAIIGDSYSEAMQVPAESTYWNRLPAMLRCHDSAEVLNFGVAGYGTAQELLTLPHAWRYQPDLILLQLTPGNDVRNNSPALERERDRPFAVRRAGAIAINTSFSRSRSYRAHASGSHAWLVILARHVRLLQLIREVQVRAVQATTLDSSEGRLNSATFAAPTDSTWEDAWALTEDLIRAIHDSATSRGTAFLAVSASFPPQVDPRPRRRIRLARELRLANLGYPDLRLNAFAVANQIDLLALTPGLADVAERTGTFLHGFGDQLGTGHWNSTGHREAARLIANHLCQTR